MLPALRLALAMLAAASAMKPSSRRHFVSGVAASAAALPRLASAADGFTKTESGLQFKDLKEGDGAVPAPGLAMGGTAILHCHRLSLAVISQGVTQ